MKTTETLLTIVSSILIQAFVWVVGTFISENIDQFIALMFVVVSYIFGAILVPVLVTKKKIIRENLIANAATMLAGGLCVLLFFVNNNTELSVLGMAVASVIVPILTGANLLLAIILYGAGLGK